MRFALTVVTCAAIIALALAAPLGRFTLGPILGLALFAMSLYDREPRPFDQDRDAQ